MQNKLFYNKPAGRWPDALPLGNGRLGAMVYGRTDIEKILLNDDTLWYGGPMDRNNPAYREKLPEIRRCILSGDIREAEELICEYMAGSPCSQRHYSYLGELDIALNQTMPFAMGGRPAEPEPDSYEMCLDIMTGVLTVEHSIDGVSYRREMFVSAPDKVMCVRLTSDRQNAIDLKLKLDRVPVSDTMVEDDRRPGLKTNGGGWPGVTVDISRAIDDRTFVLEGNDAGVVYAAAFCVACDGNIENPVSQLHVKDSSDVVIFLASSTSNRTNDPRAEVLELIEAASKKGWDALRDEHIKDFSGLMERCVLELGEPPAKWTKDRLEAVRAGGDDPALAALYFEYGRYLIVSGSRPGSLPLNLQGIWNAEFMPMWDSKYTLNINLQMNYWLSWAGNLMELHEPVLGLLETMHGPGKRTADVMYGMRGMVCHHNTDIYGDCAPQDVYMASTPWVMAGAWLAVHVWEHYRFTKDEEVLRRMYPILKDIALFYEDFLNERDGKLITCPSVSPENRYYLPDGYDTPLCYAPAMDNQLLREFFGAVIEIQKITGTDEVYGRTLDAMMRRLPEDRIGSKGQLLEWAYDYPEQMPGMGHMSHLYAAFPGTSINRRDTPELMEAVKRSLELRKKNGAGTDGWPLAWQICLDARLGDGVSADADIRKMLTDSATDSLLNAAFVFQIDGNLGASAGIAECLLQSHTGIEFLPALPVSWKSGRVTGLLARGCVTVDMEWEDGRLERAVLAPKYDGPIEITGEMLSVSCDGIPVEIIKTKSGFYFNGIAGRRYILERWSHVSQYVQK